MKKNKKIMFLTEKKRSIGQLYKIRECERKVRQEEKDYSIDNNQIIDVME